MDFLPPSGGVFRLSLVRGHCRVSHADGRSVVKVHRSEGNKKAATKQTGHAFAFSEGLASRLCSDLKSQKGELPSPAGTERISKICKYSIIGIDYHKNRVVSTKTFENTLLSAACKKRRGKLWQKERELDGTSPLDKSNLAIRFLRIVHSLKNCP